MRGRRKQRRQWLWLWQRGGNGGRQPGGGSGLLGRWGARRRPGERTRVHRHKGRTKVVDSHPKEGRAVVVRVGGLTRSSALHERVCDRGVLRPLRRASAPRAIPGETHPKRVAQLHERRRRRRRRLPAATRRRRRLVHSHHRIGAAADEPVRPPTRAAIGLRWRGGGDQHVRGVGTALSQPAQQLRRIQRRACAAAVAGLELAARKLFGISGEARLGPGVRGRARRHHRK